MSSADPGPGAPSVGAADHTAATEDRHQALLADLTDRLGDDIVGSQVLPGDLVVRVRPEAWVRAAEECQAMGFDYFCFLSGIDWAPSTSVMRGEVSSGDVGDDGEATPDDEEAAEYAATTGQDSGGPGNWKTGYTGGDTRFQVLARLYSTRRKLGVTFKADLDDEAPSVDSIVPVYRGADWHERETWEMFGFDFVGHPNLSHLYLPGEFEGYPLRKDFPLLAREVKPWPGLVDVEPMPETADDGAAAAGEEN